MSMDNFDPLVRDLKKFKLNVRSNERLAAYTTIGVGGEAKLFIEVLNMAELELAIKLAFKHNIPYRVFGNGSNIIISDSGYHGLVILNNTNHWQIVKGAYKKHSSTILSRFKTFSSEVSSDLTFSYQEKQKDEVLVRVSSGTRIGHLMNSLFKEGVSGLQWFAGIPGTVGGAIFMNIHGGDYYFGDLVMKAVITDGKSSREVDYDYFHFAYDWSILQQTREVVLSADLLLHRGDVKKAKELAKSWIRYKSQQPQRSAGCIFQNLSLEEQKRLGLPTPSVGYVIDRILKLKGIRKGEAIISTKHAAFIENSGRATANDVIYLINLVKQQAREKLGLQLKLEVELLGDL
jgi:UDP-N-acetylenolpyruvoylglucosamine reductase